MTRDQATEVLLDAGWLAIMFNDMSDKKVVACAEIELLENPDLMDCANKRHARALAIKSDQALRP